MDPLTALFNAVAALAPVVGDLIGQALGAGDMERAKQLAEQAMRDIPQIKDLAARLGPSQMENVQADAGAVSAQRAALADLQRVGEQGAENIEYRAAVDAASREASRAASARQGAIEQQMGARGMGGTGSEYALKALAGHEAASRLSGEGFQAAAEGRRQGLRALQQAGSLGTTIRDQDFGEKSARARAADDIARFNEESRAGAVRDHHNMRTQARGNMINTLRGDAQNVRETGQNYGQGIGYSAATMGQDRKNDARFQEWLKAYQAGQAGKTP